jgi:hypothetical protein
MSQLIKISPQKGLRNTRKWVPVLVCAWCGPTKYPELKAGEVYTHGMCSEHLAEWTINVRKRLHN